MFNAEALYDHALNQEIIVDLCECVCTHILCEAESTGQMPPVSGLKLL